MSVLDVLSAPFRALDSAYKTSLYGEGWQERAQQAANDQEAARQDLSMKRRLEKIKEQQAIEEAKQKLIADVTKNAAGAATHNTGPAATPLPANQAGPVVPEYDVPDAYVSSLSPELRAGAKQGAISRRRREDADTEAAHALKEAQVRNYGSMGERRSTQNELDAAMAPIRAELADARLHRLEHPEFGRAPQIVYVDGKPQLWTPGQPLPTGTDVRRQAPPAAPYKERVASGEQLSLLDRVDRLDKMVREHPDAIGYGTGTMMSARDAAHSLAPGMVDAPPDYQVQIHGLSREVIARELHERYGSALTEHEVKQIANALPDPSASSETFRERLAIFRSVLTDTLRRKGLMPAGAASGGGGGGTRQVGERKTFPNGRVGVWDGHGWRAE